MDELVKLFGVTGVYRRSGATEYLESPLGKYSRYRWRKLHGTTRYMLASAPKSKKAITTEQKVAIQHAVLKQMQALSRRAYRGRVAAEFDIYPTGQNPPHLHTVMKNILDVLAKPEPSSNIGRKGLIYQDDRQIAYLSVNYHLGVDTPGIHASFAPFGHFLQDLSLADEIIGEHYHDRSDLGDLLSELGETDRDDDDEALDEYRDTVNRRDFYVERLGEKLYDSMLNMHRHAAQESFLRLSKLGVRDAHTFYHAAGMIAEQQGSIRFPALEEASRKQSLTIANWLANSPVKAQLPRVPIQENESKPFKKAVRAGIRAYREKYGILQPLYSPVAVEVIYKPPLASGGFAKDLDNIMRIILPIFHEEFKPPVSPFWAVGLDTLGSDSFADSIRQYVAKLPKSVPYSVCRYDILEIPRPPDDKSDGFISLGITGGRLARRSLWNRVGDIIEGWHDHHENNLW